MIFLRLPRGGEPAIGCCILPRRQFLLHGVADGCRGRRFRRLVLLNLAAFLLPHRRAIAESDSPRVVADLDDLEVVLFARFQRTRALQRTRGRAEVRWALIAAPAILDLGVMAEAFDVISELDEGAERRDARNFALHDVAHFVRLEPIAPDIVHLLDSE